MFDAEHDDKRETAVYKVPLRTTCGAPARLLHSQYLYAGLHGSDEVIDHVTCGSATFPCLNQYYGGHFHAVLRLADHLWRRTRQRTRTGCRGSEGGCKDGSDQCTQLCTSSRSQVERSIPHTFV